MNPTKQNFIAPNENASKAPPSPRKTSKVSDVQSAMADQTLKGKKKGKGKNKANQPKQDPPKPQAEEGSKCGVLKKVCFY